MCVHRPMTGMRAAGAAALVLVAPAFAQMVPTGSPLMRLNDTLCRWSCPDPVSLELRPAAGGRSYGSVALEGADAIHHVRIGDATHMLAIGTAGARGQRVWVIRACVPERPTVAQVVDCGAEPVDAAALTRVADQPWLFVCGHGQRDIRFRPLEGVARWSRLEAFPSPSDQRIELHGSEDGVVRISTGSGSMAGQSARQVAWNGSGFELRSQQSGARQPWVRVDPNVTCRGPLLVRTNVSGPVSLVADNGEELRLGDLVGDPFGGVIPVHLQQPLVTGRQYRIVPGPERTTEIAGFWPVLRHGECTAIGSLSIGPLHCSVPSLEFGGGLGRLRTTVRAPAAPAATAFRCIVGIAWTEDDQPPLLAPGVLDATAAQWIEVTLRSDRATAGWGFLVPMPDRPPARRAVLWSQVVVVDARLAGLARTDVVGAGTDGTRIRRASSIADRLHRRIRARWAERSAEEQRGLWRLVQLGF
ncbi:MAG: hypothetical protein CMJ47_02025 [Planctomyces sp.]|nr:hypothetical protein [Planctomyces sp.]